MVSDILQPTHLLFVLVVALLVLGPKRLPEVARTLGNGIRDFRSALSGESDERPGDPGHYVLADENEPEHKPAASTAQPSAPASGGSATAVHEAAPATADEPGDTERTPAPAHDPSGTPPA
jgi:sec-independent protein translocase protein TatA